MQQEEEKGSQEMKEKELVNELDASSVVSASFLLSVMDMFNAHCY